MEDFLSMLTSDQQKKVQKFQKMGLSIESIADGVVVMVGGSSTRILILQSGKQKKFR